MYTAWKQKKKEKKNTVFSSFPVICSQVPITRTFFNFIEFFFYFTTGQQLPCGSTPITQSRVIGGQDAKPGAWPWQVRITVQLAQQLITRVLSRVVSRFDCSLASVLSKDCPFVSTPLFPSGSAVKELFHSVHIALSYLALLTSQMKFEI